MCITWQIKKRKKRLIYSTVNRKPTLSIVLQSEKKIHQWNPSKPRRQKSRPSPPPSRKNPLKCQGEGGGFEIDRRNNEARSIDSGTLPFLLPPLHPSSLSRGAKKHVPTMGTGGEDKKERGEERKGGEKSMHLRERAPPLIFWWLNTADNAIVADLYTRAPPQGRWENLPLPPPLPFFSIAVQYPNWFARQCNRAPQTTPIATLSTHTRAHTHTRARAYTHGETGHTPRGKETEVRPREKYQKGFGGEDRSFSPDRVFDSFSETHPSPSPSPFATMRGTIARKSVCPPLHRSVEKFPSVFFFFQWIFKRLVVSIN